MLENINLEELKNSMFLRIFLILVAVLGGFIIIRAIVDGTLGLLLGSLTKQDAGISKVLLLFGMVVGSLLLFINFFIFGAYTILAKIGIVDFVKPTKRIIPLTNVMNMMVGYKRCQAQIIQINETNNTNYNLGGIAPIVALVSNTLQWVAMILILLALPLGFFDLQGGSDSIVPFLVLLLLIMIIKYVSICSSYINLYVVTAKLYTNRNTKVAITIKWVFVSVLLITLLIAPILTFLGLPIPKVGLFNLILFFGSTIFLPVYTWVKIRGLFQYIYYTIYEPEMPDSLKYNNYNGYNY